MRLTALLLSVALTSATADARALGLLRDWALAVNQHAAGENDAALNRVTAWSYDDLEMMWKYVEAAADVPTANNGNRRTRRSAITATDLAEIRELASTHHTRVDDFRKRAAILHTDAAILGGPPPTVVAGDLRYRQPSWAKEQGNQGQREVIVRSNDGRVDNFELANLHWELAMSLLDALPVMPTHDPIVPQWYRAIGAYLARERNYAGAIRHFATAKVILPGDSQVLYGEACLQETLSAPRIQDFVRVTTLPGGLVIRGVSSPATHLRRAESMLKAALAATPDFAEANLRLGRVLTQLDRPLDALPYLQRAIDQSQDNEIRYDAHLFSGDAALTLGRLPDARASYDRAMELYPDAQAARLGLGAVLRAMGNRELALEVMEPTLTKPPAGRAADDPWWHYYDGDAARVDELLGELRAPFRSPRQ